VLEREVPERRRGGGRKRDSGLNRALASDNIQVDGRALRIPLGGSGIRSIEHDPVAGGFQVVAGHPTGAQDFRLVSWDAAKGSVREMHAFSGEHKPEGVARATLGGKAVTVVMFDDSRFAVLR